MEEEPVSYSKSRHVDDIKDDNDHDDDEGVVRCPGCGANEDNYDAENDPNGDMVQCDGCNSWQHIRCMTNGKESIDSVLNDDGNYYCDQCDPSRHLRLLGKVSDEDKEFNVDFESDINDDKFIDDEEDEDTKGGKRRRRSAPMNGNKTMHAANAKRRKSAVASVDSDGDTKLRQNALKMFNDLFSKFIIPDTVEAKVYQLPNGVTVQEKADTMAKDLESELYEACFDRENGRLNKFYPEKVRSLYSNLKDKKNLTLKSHVVNGSLPPKKLTTMNASELANPDLQAFKEKVDSESLDQLIIEQPDKPKWVKTHKGEELIESQDEFRPENDTIYAKDILTRHEPSNFRIAGTTPSVQQFPNEETETKQRNTIEVTVSYPENDTEFSGKLSYLGSSQTLERNPYLTAFGDSRLLVEGRLSKGKVLSYLHEMQATRAFLLYELSPNGSVRGETAESAADFSKLHEFLIANDKIIGIKNKQRYEKNIYLIPVENGAACFAIKSILEKNETTKLVTDNEKKMFLLVVIKPELI